MKCIFIKSNSNFEMFTQKCCTEMSNPIIDFPDISNNNNFKATLKSVATILQKWTWIPKSIWNTIVKLLTFSN